MPTTAIHETTLGRVVITSSDDALLALKLDPSAEVRRPRGCA